MMVVMFKHYELGMISSLPETIETLEDVKASRIPIYLEPGSSFTMMMQTMFPNIETRLLKGYVGKNEVVRQGSLTLVSLPYGGGNLSIDRHLLGRNSNKSKQSR